LAAFTVAFGEGISVHDGSGVFLDTGFVSAADAFLFARLNGDGAINLLDVAPLVERILEQ